AAVGAGKHGAGADVVARLVGREGLDRVPSVGDEYEQSLHPLGVLLERAQVGERFGLGSEARIRLAVGGALGPALAGLAGVEEGSRDIGDGLTGDRHGVTSLPCRADSGSRWRARSGSAP